MYKEYEGRKEVFLWFYVPTSACHDTKGNRSRSPDTGKQPKKKSSNYQHKLDEVETVVLKLKEAFGEILKEATNVGAYDTNGEACII